MSSIRCLLFSSIIRTNELYVDGPRLRFSCSVFNPFDLTYLMKSLRRPSSGTLLSRRWNCWIMCFLAERVESWVPRSFWLDYWKPRNLCEASKNAKYITAITFQKLLKFSMAYIFLDCRLNTLRVRSNFHSTKFS